VLTRGRDRGTFELHMPGVHNVQNALAALAVCDEFEVDIEITRRALAEFEGVQRRFTVRGIANDVMVVDDYGHHPTEIRATLAGARTSWPGRRVIAVVQPHRYSRLRDNFEGFVGSLRDADVVVITDVYPAGEAPIPGVDSMRLAEALRAQAPEQPVHFEAFDDVPERLAALARPGDLVITLGAGSITRVGPALVELLSNQGAAERRGRER
jgi:UDP-N-acetylmuramate--alanine ligase